MKGFVYILECSNDKFYTGSTKNLTQRLTAHWNGIGSNFTRKYPPKRLCYTAEFSSIKEAFIREQQIKKWSRAKKIALMQGDFDKLKRVSKSSTASSASPTRSLSVPRRAREQSRNERSRNDLASTASTSSATNSATNSATEGSGTEVRQPRCLSRVEGPRVVIPARGGQA